MGKLISDIDFNLFLLLRWLYRSTWKLFHLKLYRNPKLYIPKDTIYCYIHNGKNGTKEQVVDGKKIMLPYWGVDTCVFYKYLGFDLCMYNGSDCSLDSCKTCGINENWDEIEKHYRENQYKENKIP